MRHAHYDQRHLNKSQNQEQRFPHQKRPCRIKEEPGLKIIFFFVMSSVHKNQSKLQATVSLFVAIQIWIDFYVLTGQKKEDFLNCLFFSKISLLKSLIYVSKLIGFQTLMLILYP